MKLIFLFLLLGVRSSGHGNVPACSSGSTQRMVSDTRRAPAPASRRRRPTPHRAPPPPNAVDRKRRRVVVDANAYPSGVSRQVVHAVRNRLAFRGEGEVVHPHPLRGSLRALPPTDELRPPPRGCVVPGAAAVSLFSPPNPPPRCFCRTDPPGSAGDLG